VDQWIWFQLTDISTNLFNNFYLKSLISEPQPKAADELRDRALGFYRVFDHTLEQQSFLAGEQITLADLVAFPVVRACAKYGVLDAHPDLCRWFDAVAVHPQVSVWLDQQA
jgi:GST-like protein